jgi:transposase
MDAIYVGIDVSKDQLDVHVRPSGEAFAVARDGKGLNELIERLRGVEPTLVAVEATGGFETIVAAAIAGARMPLAVVNPAQVRHFAQAVGKRAKTDPIDAAIIAHFAAAVKPEPRELPDEAARLFAELVDRRKQLVEMLVAERQREKRASSGRVKKSLSRQITALDKELAVIDRDIDTMVRGSPVWREKEDLLITFPGVGNNIARVVLADLPELGHLSRRKISSLVGIAPFTRRSGKWKGKSMIAGGRPGVRSAIFMAAFSAIRCNPVLRAYYRGLLARGKPKMVALIAAARKVLTILNAMLRDKKQWQHA